ncbi:MAG: sulfurtransferase [Proteobacteria bacterium]|nr:MAG: sulfurtransferase [Pseudomonadota bacterium]
MISKGNLVSTDWLEEHVTDPNLVILDATMNSVTGDNSAIEDRPFIPGALIFDMETRFSRKDSDLPHTALSYEEFVQEIQSFGINESTTLVVYDAWGIYSSPRAWWLFKLMGHNPVFVLDGGLPKWVSEGKTTQSIPASTHSASSPWSGQYSAPLITELEQILQVSKENTARIIDARSQGRFIGEEPEPRPGLRAGHIPNALNIPFETLLENGCYKPPGLLAKPFEENSITRHTATFFYCGSGVTACVVLLAAVETGIFNVSIYDGSWAEWGADKTLPITQ